MLTPFTPVLPCSLPPLTMVLQAQLAVGGPLAAAPLIQQIVSLGLFGYVIPCLQYGCGTPPVLCPSRQPATSAIVSMLTLVYSTFVTASLPRTLTTPLPIPLTLTHTDYCCCAPCRPFPILHHTYAHIRTHTHTHAHLHTPTHTQRYHTIYDVLSEGKATRGQSRAMHWVRGVCVSKPDS